MDWIKKNGSVVRCLVFLVLSVVFAVGLAEPAWTLYVQAKDLGPGGVGGEAQEDTPVAHSIAEMEAMERFAVHAVQTSWDDSEGVHLPGGYYRLATLDSGEQIAMRVNSDADRYDPANDFWGSPIGAWRPWALTDQERAILAREAPGLTTTDYYADMLGNRESALSRKSFTSRFTVFGAIGAMAVLAVCRALWRFRQRRQKEITRPRNDLELWLVGTYAIWGQFYAGLYGSGMEAARKGPFYIGAVPRTRETLQGMKDTLDDSWDIGNYAELLDTVEYMSVGPGFHNCINQAGRAWELCRSMQLLGCAYLVEWCDREEMVRRSCQVGEIIQRTFQSWDELCQSFLDGFAAWRLSGSADESDMASVQQRADIYWAIKGRKDSPYNLPWGMELKPAKK